MWTCPGGTAQGLFHFLRICFTRVRHQHRTSRAGPVDMISVRGWQFGGSIDQQKISTVGDAGVARWLKREFRLFSRSSCQCTGKVISVNIDASRMDMPEARALGNLASCASSAPAANPHAEAEQQVRPHSCTGASPTCPGPCSTDYRHSLRLLSRLSLGLLSFFTYSHCY